MPNVFFFFLNLYFRSLPMNFRPIEAIQRCCSLSKQVQHVCAQIWLKRLQISRQDILNAQVSRNVNIYTVVIRSRSSELTGQTPDRSGSAAETVLLAYLHGHRRIFAQRLLRQSRVKSNFHHGEEKRWASWQNKKGEPGDGGPSFAASACDAVCNFVPDQGFRSLQGIRTVTE